MLYNILEERMLNYLKERGFEKKVSLFDVAKGRSSFTLEGTWEKEGGIILDVIPPTNKNDDETASLSMFVSTPLKKGVIIGWWNNLEKFLFSN